jgi:hypothetical protein
MDPLAQTKRGTGFVAVPPGLLMVTPYEPGVAGRVTPETVKLVPEPVVA